MFSLKPYTLKASEFSFSVPENCNVVRARVSRLGEFLPIGSLITLGSFVKIIEVAAISRLLFYTQFSFIVENLVSLLRRFLCSHAVYKDTRV
jgi:hypothetical protein